MASVTIPKVKVYELYNFSIQIYVLVSLRFYYFWFKYDLEQKCRY